MKKDEEEDDLEPEYDLRTLLKVAKAFPNHQAVNDALRLVIQLSQITGVNKKVAT
jgi:hypothetical protein